MIPPRRLSHGSVARRKSVPRANQQPGARQLCQRADNRCRVIRYDARRLAPERALVVGLRDEGMAGSDVLLSTLQDEMTPALR